MLSEMCLVVSDNGGSSDGTSSSSGEDSDAGEIVRAIGNND